MLILDRQKRNDESNPRRTVGGYFLAFVGGGSSELGMNVV